MKKKYSLSIRLLTTCLLAVNFFSETAFAQTGKNDSTFNVPDNGPDASFKGTDYTVIGSAIQHDNNKIVLIGSFTKYNSSAANGIVRTNMDGSTDNSFVSGSGFDESPNTILLQPDNRAILGGPFTNYNGITTNRIVRLNENGSIDSNFLTGSGFNGEVDWMALQADQKILVLGKFTQYDGKAVKGIMRLNTDGQVDTTFHAFDTAYNYCRTFALQADGKIIVPFARFEEIELIRLNADGTRDPSFYSINSFHMKLTGVRSIAVQADNKIVFGGYSFEGNSPDYYYVRRLNPNGEADTTFHSPLNENHVGTINVIRLQNDGKIFIAGNHDKKGDEEHSSAPFIARLNTDGSLDSSFSVRNKKINFLLSIYSLSIQADGKVVIGGSFPEIDAYTVHNITRLNADGTPDITFNKTTGVNGDIRASAVQSNGKIMIGGYFSTVHYQPRSHIARLFADGTLDSSFNPGTGTNGAVYAIAVQPDGKIIIAGDFTAYNGLPVPGLARLNSDGSIDPSYNVGTGTNFIIYTLQLQSDMKLLIGGSFSQFNGTDRKDVARLNTDGSLDMGFTSALTNDIYPDEVYSILPLPSGKIMIGGYFRASTNDAGKKNLIRVNANGTLDNSFQQTNYSHVRAIVQQPDGKIIAAGGEDLARFHIGNGFITRYTENGVADTSFFNSFEPGIKPVHSITLLPSGKIIAGGEFDWFGGSSLQHILLMDSTGVIDTSFIGKTDGTVYTTQLVADNKVVIGGEFNTYTGIPRNHIARIMDTDIILNIKNNGSVTEQTFSMYPNPASTSLTIDQLKTNATLFIRNICGAVVHTEQINTTKRIVNLSDFANGIYFITILGKNQLQTQRLIVAK